MHFLNLIVWEVTLVAMKWSRNVLFTIQCLLQSVFHYNDSCGVLDVAILFDHKRNDIGCTLRPRQHLLLHPHFFYLGLVRQFLNCHIAVTSFSTGVLASLGGN